MSQPTLVCRIPQNLWRFALSGGNTCRSGHCVLWAKNSTDIFHMIGMGHFKGRSTIKGFVLLYPLNKTPSLGLCTCWFRNFWLCTCLCRTDLRTCRQDFEIVYELEQDWDYVRVCAGFSDCVHVGAGFWDCQCRIETVQVRVGAGLRLCSCLCRFLRLCTCGCTIFRLCTCVYRTGYNIMAAWGRKAASNQRFTNSHLWFVGDGEGRGAAHLV